MRCWINISPPAATTAVSAREEGAAAAAKGEFKPEEADHRLSASRPTRPVYTSASRLCLQLAHIFVLLRLNSSDVYFASLEL